MAIVWQGPFNREQAETQGGPSLGFGAYDDVDSNYATNFEIIGGADADLVYFDANGRLAVKPEYLVGYKGFETPLGGDNVIEVTLKAHHQWFSWGLNDWVVTEGVETYRYAITDLLPTLYPLEGVYGSVTEGTAAGTTILTFSANQLSDGTGPAVLSLSGSAGGRFVLVQDVLNPDSYHLQVAAAALLDYESLDPSSAWHTVTLGVSDGGANRLTKDIAIYVNNAGPSTPVDQAGPAGGTVAEHAAAGTAVGIDAGAADPNGGGIIYSLDGSHPGLTIDAQTGVVTVGDARLLNYEATNGEITVRVVAAEADAYWVTSHAEFKLTVRDVNDAPEFTPGSLWAGGFAYDETLPETAVNAEPFQEGSGLVVGRVAAQDEDRVPAADKLTYSLSGTDAARLAINAATGEVRFKAMPDFEKPADADKDNVYEVVVTAKDGQGGSSAVETRITVSDTDEAPVIAGPATKVITWPEGPASRVLYTVDAADPEGKAVTYAIAGVEGFFNFTIDSAGRLRFINNPDYEYPADFNQDNTYEFRVVASDGQNVAGQTVRVTVVEAEEAPVIMTNGGGAAAAVTVMENHFGAVAFVGAYDPDPGSTLTYSLVSSADKARFAIDPNSGILTFVASPDFESPADAGRDNVYNVKVRVSDGTLTDEQTIAVTVTDVLGMPKTGGGGADALTGSAEAETLNGKGGADTLTALGGADTLIGGTGADDLHGGADAARDVFVFARGDSGKTLATWDRLYDVKSGIDRIDLSAIDADAAAGQQDLRFVTAFTPAKGTQPDGQFRVVDAGADLRVEIDYDGNGTVDAVLQVMKIASLSAADFVL